MSNYKGAGWVGGNGDLCTRFYCKIYNNSLLLLSQTPSSTLEMRGSYLLRTMFALRGTLQCYYERCLHYEAHCSVITIHVCITMHTAVLLRAMFALRGTLQCYYDPCLHYEAHCSVITSDVCITRHTAVLLRAMFALRGILQYYYEPCLLYKAHTSTI